MSYFTRGSNDVTSCEDIAVSQYMNELITEAVWKNESEVPKSSCSKLLKKKMASCDKPPQHRVGHRPSKSAGARRLVAGWTSIPTEHNYNDSNKQDDYEHYQTTKQLSSPRPASAPSRHKRTQQRSSLLSVSSSDLDQSGSSLSNCSDVRNIGRGRHKPLHKQKNNVLCLRAFVNGDRERYARITAANFKQLLEECTTKLALVSAARKIFLSDGTLVRGFEQIKNNSDIYISCGEAFKDPFGKYKEKEKLGRLSTWTMNGISFPESKTRGKTKPSLSQRMLALVEKQKRRILVFTNGDHTKGKEVVAGRFDEFLEDCTQKLLMDVEAKGLHDWDGKEITNFSEVPVLESVLQPSTNTVIGPLWVTRGGEKFSFKGVQGFVAMLSETTKERMKEAKDYENQLVLRRQGSNQATSVEVMSFTSLEIDSELQQIRRKIQDLESVMPKLKSRKKRLKLKTREEEMNSASDSSFKFQNIAEIQENSGLLGRKGIRLKVYENGKTNDEVIIYFNVHESSKGICNDPNMLMSRLLDTITTHRKMIKHGPAGRLVAKKIYRDNGDKVVNVHELNTDDCIWLSFGEPFISPYTFALHLVVDKTKSLSLWDDKKVIQREPLNDDDVSGKEKASLWRIVAGYPVSGCSVQQDVNLDEMEHSQRIAYIKGLQPSQVQETNTFLQLKKNKDIILYPELSVETKLLKGDTNVWPSDCQKWAIDESGFIYSRTFPQLCLSTTKMKVKVNYKDETSLQGWIVKLTKRNACSSQQIWQFTPTGDICNMTDPDLLLSWIANEEFLLDNDDLQDIQEQRPQVEINGPDHAENDSEVTSESKVPNMTSLKDVFGGEKYSVAVLPKLPSKHESVGTQRWALKQESFNKIGQWKYSQVSNPEWNRRAFSWPVKQDGTRNEDFQWPMEGCLVCNAPVIKRRDTSGVGPPVRLQVRKNGETDPRQTVTVVGPDLSNMAKDSRKKSTSNIARTSSSTLSSPPSDMRSLELILFLDRCTQALRLSFAARRLFDETGAELFNMAGLERDHVVYVSCGEAWHDGKTLHSEQQRRIIVTNLASDVAKLRQYHNLHNPQDLVLALSGAVTMATGVCVIKLKKEDIVEEDQEEMEDVEEPQDSLESIRANLLSAHERAHVKSEERLKTLQWPWETAITTNGEISAEDFQHGDFEHDVVYSNHRLDRKFRQHSVRAMSAKDRSLYQWCFKDQFIYLRGHSQLVLAPHPNSSNDNMVNEVILCKRKSDDINQRWIIEDDGSVQCRSNSDLVLTVSEPRMDDGGSPGNSMGYQGCSVVVMARKLLNGNAHQLWSFDDNTGLFMAFSTDHVNKAITAANKIGICTYAVVGSRKVPQTKVLFGIWSTIQYKIYKGYTSGKDDKLLCDACGKCLRGKMRLEKTKENQQFSCVMGEADKPDKSSCFKCLSNKVDLTRGEAEATVCMWEEQLSRLRKISTLRSLNKEMQVAQCVPAVRIRAYRNGEGSRAEPVLVIGNTVDSLLAQCTSTLGLTKAARRLYSVNGLQITDINQLRHCLPASPNYDSVEDKSAKNNRGKKVGKKSSDDPIDMVSSANQYNSPKEDTSSLHDPSSLVGHSGQHENKQATDVFVSCGEPFVPLQEIDKQYLLQRKHQNQRTWVEKHLETEKHVLRQMQGRRISARASWEISPGEYLSWEDLEKMEEDKQENIEELTEHLKDLKCKQQVEKAKVVSSTRMHTARAVLTNTRLYNGTRTVRINVYENGDFEKGVVSVCGSSLLEILNVCTSRLGLSAAARRMFTRTGQEVFQINNLVKGDSYCVSCGENFIPPVERQNTVERKATWSRLNKMSGGAMTYKSSQSSSLQLALAHPTYSG